MADKAAGNVSSAKPSRARKGDTEGDPLEIVVVIDAMEVGPVQLEPQRLIMPYQVRQGEVAHRFELSYRYEEEVFDPEDPASLNLAGMIGAQVAINYGLFCRRMVFRGHFDEADRRFIAAMMRNTAREIYVKKFVEPNPFLRAPATELPVVKKEDYVFAGIEFEDLSLSEANAGGKNRWAGDGFRVAVSSSGGKDSLLTFGLLREIGAEVHPIFLNESGRHWYTALNAYRYLHANHSHTARVWTNADRLFAWMLRRLPFVRQDFARVRSDEYPIRLWTVAVFLFGALPLVRKRGIGALLIGDEYDTTRRTAYHGITHYDGLYDQSRYFDDALTRYYRRKGWGVVQFSILRPLSELLIEKILAERYPELQQHQVSCHAAHIEGERVRPCGRCEKCRRIVGMLVALGADPRRCGYSDDQIRLCLSALAGTEIHQESAAAEHMRYLLVEKGLLPSGAPSLPARPHPEVLKLRFDPVRSPYDAIPVGLREPLYRMLLQHAEGAVERRGRIWVDCDPFSEPSLSRPYPFQPPDRRLETTANPSDLGPSHPMSYLLGELTWPEAESRFKEVDVALLPVGAIEQHGPHLPLDTDAFDADYLARQVAAACSDPKPLVLPLIPYGVSYHHDDFAGTLSVSNETLSRLVYEVGLSAARNGIAKLVILNGHGGNAPALKFAAQMLNRDAHIFTCVESGETSDADIHAMIETPNDVHAGEIETSTSLAVRRHLVQLDKARRFVPRFSSRYLDFTSKRSVEWYARTAKISPSGVLGDPTRASREKGEKIWAVMIERLVEFVEHLKSLTLDEIYEKRY